MDAERDKLADHADADYEYAPIPRKIVGTMVAVSKERMEELKAAERKLAAVREVVAQIAKCGRNIHFSGQVQAVYEYCGDQITKALETE